MIIPIIRAYGDTVLLRHIRYLLAVADHGNFTRAAETLHVSQPALSQQIKQLEGTLGVQLFDRSGRTVVLTDAGRVYLEYARRSLRELDAGQQALMDVGDLSRGRLRLGVTPTFNEYLVAPLIDRFTALHPGVAIALTEMSLEQVVTALGNDALDLAIGFNGDHGPEVECQPLFDETLCLVMGGPERPKPPSLSLADLQALPFALLTPEFATRRLVDTWCQAQRFTPSIALEANSIAILLKVVAQGRMATILPRAIVGEQPALHEVPLTLALPRRTAALLRRSDAYRSVASQAFVRLLHGEGRLHRS